jgi:hypothetical protein
VELQLSVVFEVTADEKQVRLVTTGHLTTTNQQVLYPMIHRARALTSTTEVIVDLSAIEHLEPGALDLLSWEIDQDGPDHPAQTVRVILPELPPVSGPSCEAGDAT